MKLILHLGFPKTMSSSLQFGLFKNLHKKGKVNLITWRLDDVNEKLLDRPSSRLFIKKKLLDRHLNFLPDKVNILSDESFTAPIKLRRINFGADIIDPIKFPKILFNSIKNKYPSIKIYPLVIIRNQADLIYSQYVEEYNLKKYKNINLVFDDNGNVNLKGFEIYKFNRYLIELKKYFDPDKIGLFLFEDIIKSKKEISNYFHKILKIDVEEILINLSESHFNKKKKTNTGYYTHNKEHLIPYFSEKTKEDILDFFLEDNLKLNKLLNISLGDQKYCYL